MKKGKNLEEEKSVSKSLYSGESRDDYGSKRDDGSGGSDSEEEDVEMAIKNEDLIVKVIRFIFIVSPRK